MRECFCFGSEAVNASGEAVRGLVKSRVEFPPAQISGVFELRVHQCTRISDWLRALKRQSNVNLYLSFFPREKVCFQIQICCIEGALDSLNIRGESRKIMLEEEQERDFGE